ncbi:MAG: MerR family transcriptional regulator [Candidatus Melainabacteria bacterium]
MTPFSAHPSPELPADQAGIRDAKTELTGVSPDGYLTIGSLARLCGVTVRTLRYYEEMDLIGPIKRTNGKYRLYNRYSLKRIQAIMALQALNYSLEEIQVTLGPYSRSREFTRSEQVEATRRSLQLQAEAIDLRLEQLKTMRTDLQHRMDLLNNHCEPCQHHLPDDSCQEHCSYLETHY